GAGARHRRQAGPGRRARAAPESGGRSVMEVTATEVAFVALLLFFGLLIYLKVPQQIAGMLDSRSQAIAKELHEARRLREEAEALLADYETKRAAAETEAQAIVEAAKEQAAAVAEETRLAMQAAMA